MEGQGTRRGAETRVRDPERVLLEGATSSVRGGY